MTADEVYQRLTADLAAMSKAELTRLAELIEADPVLGNAVGWGLLRAGLVNQTLRGSARALEEKVEGGAGGEKDSGGGGRIEG